MRIAVCGTHGTGKSTLLIEVQSKRRDYATIPEAYDVAIDAGHDFSDRPTIDDFLALVDISIATIRDGHEPNVLFDRSPADYLAYVAALDANRVSSAQIDEVRDALAALDLIVFVPIEQPDRIGNVELPRLRKRVDRILYEMLIDDSLSLGAAVLEVHGTLAQRSAQVIARIEQSDGHE
jgi:predicted ATPase